MKPFICLSCACLAVVLSCHRPTEEKEPTPPQPSEHVDEPEHEALPTRVQLSPDVLKAAGVKSARVDLAALPATFELAGEVASDPDRTADVTAPVQARVASVAVKDGERVKRGELIAVLESAELARARAALTSAQARSAAARLNADRLARLAEKGLASGQERKEAEAQAVTAEADALAARQALAAFGTEVSRTGGARLELLAPIAGFVVARDAVPGQFVEANHPLLRVVDLEHAYFLARLFEKDLGRVSEGASAEVRLNAWPDEAITGTVESVGRALDPVARTVVARVSLTGAADHLRVGLFGKARLSIGGEDGGTPRPVVPLSSVTRIANQDVVFVAHPDGDFEVHPVKLGATAGGRAEVLTGLREGEEVVTDGVFTLKSAVLKGTFGEEE